MRDPPARHDGRWLMTPLDPTRGEIRTTTIMTTPRTNGSPGFSFHLRDTELLVTAFPGCRTRFFLLITTCHATASLFLSLYHSTSALRSLQVGPLLLLSPLFPLFLPLFRPLARGAQSSISNDYARRSPQVDPTARRTREADRCNQGDRFTKV